MVVSLGSSLSQFIIYIEIFQSLVGEGESLTFLKRSISHSDTKYTPLLAKSDFCFCLFAFYFSTMFQDSCIFRCPSQKTLTGKP